MAAMVPSSGGQHQSSNPYEQYDAPTVDDDLIDPDDATLEDLEDPAQQQSTSDRANLLSGNISSTQSHQNARAANQTGNYLTSAIPGEDRRAPQNTIDESVWETLKRDLLAVCEKMRQVLWPKYLLGGVMGEGEGMMGGVRNVRSVQEGMEAVRGLVGRWPDADTLLQAQGGMSEGLRDWDLWGPLLFSLLLSFLLSLNARDDQRSFVFSGVFATVWIAEAIVTLQIKLLGGNISFFQSVCIIGYTLFPLVIASLLSALHVPTIVRIPVYSVLGLWSLAAGVSILGGSGVVKNRVALAVYPLFVFYVGLDCLCFIS
ncbi:Yip1-domain-containing protein [Teratosphaeria nubilosa]|uniref:Protein YIP n=1 Tax=Teratosphaeria nubilosa TaxID=161662 RepID=A0A6G1LNK4_9PEZI|nr:Yip1-domain-containing protein [Teratosphaeria nubilosa]